MPLQLSEVSDRDLDEAIAFRSEIFSRVTRHDWEREGNVTGFVAREAGRIVGVLTVVFRRIRLGPGRHLNAAFHHAVGVAPTHRGKGIGTELLSYMRERVKDRADALCLYRTDESSAGYRFYVKNGHADLHYCRLLRNAATAVPAGSPDVQVNAGVEAIVAAEPDLLVVFGSCYQAFGGFRERTPGFYAAALGGLIFAGHPHSLFLIRHERDEQLLAYAIVGHRTSTTGERTLRIFELASLEADPTAARTVVEGILSLASSLKMPAEVLHSDSSPIFGTLLAAGFQPQTRHFAVMAHLLSPARVAPTVWQEVPELRNVTVSVWTPENEWIVHQATATPSRKVSLEMKPETLARLLTGRLNAAAAIDMEQITAIGLQPGDAAAITKACPWTPWCYHDIDYI